MKLNYLNLSFHFPAHQNLDSTKIIFSFGKNVTDPKENFNSHSCFPVSLKTPEARRRRRRSLYIYLSKNLFFACSFMLMMITSARMIIIWFIFLGQSSMTRSSEDILHVWPFIILLISSYFFFHRHLYLPSFLIYRESCSIWLVLKKF